MTEKTIDTLVEDIQNTLVTGVHAPSLADKYGQLFAEMLKEKLSPDARNQKRELRMSSVGKPCERQLWYECNGEKGEEMPPEAYMKFLFGDCIELLLLFLAEAAGHEVTGTQTTQEIEGVQGHRDAVIDGTLVDVKSASTFSFRKFKDGTLAENDSFGYIDQLQSYLYAGQTDDTITDKNRAGFLVVDKTLGHICLDIHERSGIPYDAIYRHKKEVISGDLPERGFEPIPMGKSGNEVLPMNCSYCQFKHSCHDNLRSFVYSDGIKHFTKVEKEPNVTELINV